MKGFIYIIKNFINNKVYIGQTRTSIEQRWKEHIRHASYGDQVINKAMNKHGVENFYIEILETCSLQELDEREIYYIKLYDSTNKSKGYNVSIGGNTPRFKRPLLNTSEIIRLYTEELLTLEQIANIYNVSRYIINTELTNSDIKIRDRHKSCEKFSRINKEVLIEAINNTSSLRKAAKYAGIKYSTFRNACIYNHIEYNSSTSAQHSDKE